MKAIHEIVVPKLALKPQNLAGDGSLTGEVIDRKGYDYALFLVEMGAVTGSPTGLTIDAKIQECATSGGTYTDIAGAAMTQISSTTGGVIGKIGLKLSEIKDFIKLIVTADFTAGTTPAVNLGGSCLLGWEQNQPV